jgi:hypothetical protein
MTKQEFVQKHAVYMSEGKRTNRILLSVFIAIVLAGSVNAALPLNPYHQIFIGTLMGC